jgi:hypothetical protein
MTRRWKLLKAVRPLASRTSLPVVILTHSSFPNSRYRQAFPCLRGHVHVGNLILFNAFQRSIDPGYIISHQLGICLEP